MVGECNRIDSVFLSLGMRVVANFIRQNGEVSVLEETRVNVFHMIQVSDGKELTR